MDEQFTETTSFSDDEYSFIEPPEPEVIGSGVVQKVLGKGGTAVVYEIWNSKMEVHRAVKLWRLVNSEKIIQRFETEIKITAKLHHANIVEIYAVGEWRGLPYIEMEKIEGENLKSFSPKKKRLCPILLQQQFLLQSVVLFFMRIIMSIRSKVSVIVVLCTVISSRQIS